MVLRPGEAIFVPAFWFHHVTAVAEGSGAQGLPPRWRERGSKSHSSRSHSSRSEQDAPEMLRGRQEWDWASVSVSLNVFSHSRATLAASSVLNRRPPSLAARGDGGHEAFAFLAHALVEELGADPDLPAKLFRSRYEPIASGKGGGGAASGGEGGGGPHSSTTIEAAGGAGTTKEECATGVAGGALAVQDQDYLRAWAAGTADALSGEDSALVRELLLHHADAGGEEHSHRAENAAGKMGGAGGLLLRGERGGGAGGGGGVGGDVDLLAREAASGVIEITAAHLLELVALRNFGRCGVANALQYAAFRR